MSSWVQSFFLTSEPSMKKLKFWETSWTNLNKLHLVGWICIYMSKFYISKPYKTFLTFTKLAFFSLHKATVLILSVFSSVHLFQKYCSRQNTSKSHNVQNQVFCTYIYLCICVAIKRFLKSIFTCFIRIYKNTFCVQIKLCIIQFSIWKN